MVSRDTKNRAEAPPAMSTTQSVILNAAGAGSFGAGAVAVFTSTSESGSVALILVGALLFVIGMSRRWPSRIRVGEAEVELQAAQKFVEEAVADTPSSERGELVERLGELASSSSVVASAGLRAASYEQTVEDLVRRIAVNHPGLMEIIEPASVGSRFDILLRGNSTSVGVECRYSSAPLSVVDIKRLHARFLVGATAAPMRSLLVVMSQQPSRDAMAYVDSIPELGIVAVAGSEDFAFLQSTLVSLLGQ